MIQSIVIRMGLRCGVFAAVLGAVYLGLATQALAWNEPQWVRQLGTTAAGVDAYNVATVAAGNVYLTGYPMTTNRIIGKWYYGLGNGQYIRYQFTEVGAYSYSNPLKMVSGTFAVQDDRLTLRPSDGPPESFTFRFECIGRGSFSEYMTLKSTATHLETPFVRDPTDPGHRCK